MLRPDRIAFGSGEPDPDRTYVEGLFLSEGWCNKETQFCISGKDGFRKEALKHEIKAICERLGVPTYWHKRYIGVNDRTWAQELSLRGSRARFKNARTLNLGEAEAAALLRGIMSDSTKNTRGPGRTFNTTSRKLMVQTRVLHRMFGVSTSVRMMTPDQHGGAGKHPLWRMGVRGRDNEREEWSLRVRSVDREVQKVPCWDIQTEDHYVYLPEHDVTVSNCDDLTVLFVSLMLAVGFNACVVKQSWGSGVQEHVLGAVEDENGGWLKCDPSHKDMPAGGSVPAEEELMFHPLEAVGSVGAGAELTTFGALPPVGVGARQENDGHVWEWSGSKWKLVGPAVGVGRVPQARMNQVLQTARATASRPVVGVGLVNGYTVQAYEPQVSGMMDSANEAVAGCSNMTPTDVAQWNGVYSTWQTWDAQVKTCLSSPASSPFVCLNLGSWGEVLDQLKSYEATARKWQLQVQNACPSYHAPPVPAPPPNVGPYGGGGGGGPTSWVDDVKEVGKVVGLTAAGLVLAYGTFKVIQVAGGYANRSSAARGA